MLAWIINVFHFYYSVILECSLLAKLSHDPELWVIPIVYTDALLHFRSLTNYSHLPSESSDMMRWVMDCHWGLLYACIAAESRFILTTFKSFWMSYGQVCFWPPQGLFTGPMASLKACLTGVSSDRQLICPNHLKRLCVTIMPTGLSSTLLYKSSFVT